MPEIVFSLRNLMNFYHLAHIVLFPSLRLKVLRELHSERPNWCTAVVKGLLIFPIEFLTQQGRSWW